MIWQPIFALAALSLVIAAVLHDWRGPRGQA